MVKNHANKTAKQFNNDEVATKPELSQEEATTASKTVTLDSQTKTQRLFLLRKPRSRRYNTRGKHPMPVFLRVPCAILFLLVISIFLTWFIFWQQNLRDAEAAWEFVQDKPILAVYSCVVVFCLLTTIAAITWRPFFSAGLLFCVVSILTFAHIQKYTVRAAPLLPEDLAMAESAGNLIDFVDSDELTRLIAGVIFVLVGSILLEFYMRKLIGRNPRRLPWWSKISLIPRLTYSMLALALMAMVTGPIIHRRGTDWLEGLEFVAWSQTDNYKFNGFVIGFLYNLGHSELEAPEDYSEARMMEIAEKYRQKQKEDTERKAWDKTIDNLVIILAETFYEPAFLSKYYDHYGGDITPNLHQLFREYPSGYMYSPEYGGGTANVEFEVQTGLSNFWANTFPYVNALTRLDKVLSAAEWGKEKYDFSALGLHSYDGTMYKRNIVYPKMGYDRLIDASEMTYTEREYYSSVINDRSIYKEVLDLLKDSDQPQVLGVVTMQNHGPYEQSYYPKLEFPLKEADPTVNRFAIESSYQSLHESDRYLREFLDEIDQMEERTAVLWFGDHAMGTLDKYIYAEDKSERDLAHLTPYFVYANFEIESLYTVQEVAEMNAEQGFEYRTRGVDLPTTSPNCLLNTAYNILQIEKPALFYLVDEVCMQTPILTHPYYGTEEPVNSPELHEYELVNYDVLNGKHYWDGK